MSFEPVSPNDPWVPPGAEVHNAMLEAAKRARGRLDSSEPGGIHTPFANAFSLINRTGTQLLRGDVVAVQDAEYEATSSDWLPFESPLLVGTAPVWPDDAGRLAIVLETIPAASVDAGEYVGDVALNGPAYVNVEVLNTDHRWVWFSGDASNPMKTGTGGQAKIIGKVPAVGAGKYVLVDLSREQPLWRFERGASDYQLFDLFENDMSQTFTLHDPDNYFERVDEAGWNGHVQWIDDRFYPAAAPCEKLGYV